MIVLPGLTIEPEEAIAEFLPIAVETVGSAYRRGVEHGDATTFHTGLDSNFDEVFDDSIKNPEIDVVRNFDEFLSGIKSVKLREFALLSFDVLKILNETKLKLEFKPLTRTEALTHICELYSVYLDHSDAKPRHDGTDVVESHLVGVQKILIQTMHLTGMTLLVAAPKHDDIEDLNKAVEQLLNLGAYEHYFEKHKGRSVDKDIKSFKKKVGYIVAAVSALKFESRKEKAEQAFGQLCKYMINNNDIRIPLLKLADRVHNMLTIEGHLIGKDGKPKEGEALEKAKEKMRDIAIETEMIFIPLARYFKLDDVATILTKQVCKGLNPDLYSYYEEAVFHRADVYLRPNLSGLEALVKEAGVNSKFEFSVKSLDSYSKTVDKSLEGMVPNDLGIRRRDPMFTIDIMVDTPGEVDVMVDYLSTCTSDDKPIVDGASLGAAGTEYSRGVVVKVYDPKYGGLLTFRVNDAVTEAHSKRGVKAGTHGNKIPNEILGPLTRLYRAYSRGEFENLIQASNRELLKPHVSVHTLDKKLLSLPSGSTLIDFAAAVPMKAKDLLRGLMEGWAFKSRKDETEADLFLDPCDEVPDGHVIQVVSCMDHDNRDKGPELYDPSCSRINPSWVEFAATKKARDSLRGALAVPMTIRGMLPERFADVPSMHYKRKGMDPAEKERIIDLKAEVRAFERPIVVENGKRYLKEFCDVFHLEFDGIFYEKLLTTYKKTHNDEDEVHYMIGAGKISLIEEFGMLVEDNRKDFMPETMESGDRKKFHTWNVVCILEDRPKARLELDAIVGSYGLNIANSALLDLEWDMYLNRSLGTRYPADEKAHAYYGFYGEKDDLYGEEIPDKSVAVGFGEPSEFINVPVKAEHYSLEVYPEQMSLSQFFRVILKLHTKGWRIYLEDNPFQNPLSPLDSSGAVGLGE